MLATLFEGGSYWPLPKWDAEESLSLIESAGITLVHGVPAMYNDAVNVPDAGSYDLSSVRFANAGGSSLPREVMERFEETFGVDLYEGYGLTETSPVLSANRPGATRLGTVGVPYPGVELRIGADGEILARGPGIMQGYWNAEEATRAALDDDGWFHTGDVGEFDGDGFLRITDRLKDLIVTAGGKNIAPQPVESEIMRSPFVAQAIMVGDRRAFPAVLVVPDWEAVDAWADEQGLDLSDREAATRHPKLLELLHDETVDRVRDFARHETPKRFSLLPDEFTVEAGLLTPTLKVRRRAAEQAFHEAIEKLYAEIEHVREEVRNLRHRHERSKAGKPPEGP